MMGMIRMTVTYEAIFAGITLLILWSSTVLGAGIWLMNRMNQLRDDILKDFNLKHEANAQTVKALEVLVIRHDVMLNPEFGARGNGRIQK